jgi:Ca2+-binding RTX toxin-like protein
VQVTGGAGTDAISNFENLTGSSYNDYLAGDLSANVISGGAGNDYISGGEGNDTLDGGSGTDTLGVYGGMNENFVSLLVGVGGSPTACKSRSRAALKRW